MTSSVSSQLRDDESVDVSNAMRLDVVEEDAKYPPLGLGLEVFDYPNKDYQVTKFDSSLSADSVLKDLTYPICYNLFYNWFYILFTQPNVSVPTFVLCPVLAKHPSRWPNWLRNQMPGIWDDERISEHFQSFVWVALARKNPFDTRDNVIVTALLININDLNAKGIDTALAWIIQRVRYPLARAVAEETMVLPASRPVENSPRIASEFNSSEMSEKDISDQLYVTDEIAAATQEFRKTLQGSELRKECVAVGSPPIRFQYTYEPRIVPVPWGGEILDRDVLPPSLSEQTTPEQNKTFSTVEKIENVAMAMPANISAQPELPRPPGGKAIKDEELLWATRIFCDNVLTYETSNPDMLAVSSVADRVWMRGLTMNFLVAASLYRDARGKIFWRRHGARQSVLIMADNLVYGALFAKNDYWADNAQALSAWTRQWVKSRSGVLQPGSHVIRVNERQIERFGNFQQQLYRVNKDFDAVTWANSDWRTILSQRMKSVISLVVAGHKAAKSGQNTISIERSLNTAIKDVTDFLKLQKFDVSHGSQTSLDAAYNELEIVTSQFYEGSKLNASIRRRRQIVAAAALLCLFSFYLGPRLFQVGNLKKKLMLPDTNLVITRPSQLESSQLSRYKKPSPTPKAVEKPSPTPKAVEKPSPTPKAVEKPSPTPKAVEKPSPTPKAVEKPSPTPKAVEKPSPTPKAVEKPSPTPKAVEKPSPTPKAEEKPSPTPKAVEKPSPTPKAEEKPSPTPKAEEKPSPTPKAEEKPSPTPKAVEKPSPTLITPDQPNSGAGEMSKALSGNPSISPTNKKEPSP